MTALQPRTREDDAALRTLPDGHTYAGVPDVGSLPRLGIDEPPVEPVEPTAPDGLPWRKCCRDCQYRDKPTIKAVDDDCAEAGAAFYCVHRQDGDGRYRVCAGFAARDLGRVVSEDRT